MDNAELEVKKTCVFTKKNYVHLNSCRSINAKPFLVSFLVVSCLLSLGFNICHCLIYTVSTERAPLVGFLRAHCAGTGGSTETYIG